MNSSPKGSVRAVRQGSKRGRDRYFKASRVHYRHFPIGFRLRDVRKISLLTYLASSGSTTIVVVDEAIADPSDQFNKDNNSCFLYMAIPLYERKKKFIGNILYNNMSLVYITSPRTIWSSYIFSPFTFFFCHGTSLLDYRVYLANKSPMCQTSPRWRKRIPRLLDCQPEPVISVIYWKIIKEFHSPRGGRLG